MNRRSLTISAALLTVVIVVFAFFAFFGGGGSGSRPEIPTGPGQASEARGIIAEIEERRSEEASQAPAAREPQLIGRAAPEEAPAARGAVAVTPEPQPAAPSGANAELDETFEQALALQADGKLDDAQMLYFFAARQGHAQSAYRYAEMNDPLHHSAGGSLLPEPDPNAAFRYYQIALQGGSEDAAERLEALHQWTIDAAAAGNIDAEMLLVQWE
jgi:TPR repeat protein